MSWRHGAALLLLIAGLTGVRASAGQKAQIGIEEKGHAAAPDCRAAPKGDVRLAPGLLRAGEEFSKAFVAAVRRGDAGEDDSHGHAPAPNERSR